MIYTKLQEKKTGIQCTPGEKNCISIRAGFFLGKVGIDPSINLLISGFENSKIVFRKLLYRFTSSFKKSIHLYSKLKTSA